MPELPEGVVTFVFTDVEGSTRLWEDAPESMMEALNQHDEVIEAVIADHSGISVKPRGEGDSRFLVFAHAVDAVASIAEIQTGLAATDWVTPRPIRIRASLHTGTAGVQLGDYYGSAVNQAARLRGIAHGGQTVMSASTWELVQDQMPEGVTVKDMGEHGLKDLTRPEHVYQINIEGVPDDFPALKSLEAVPNNLPQQLTDFVGREKELADAKHLLADTRLLTILAPGGTGKTRLGIQAAADLISDYPDGVFFVGLADIGSSDEIIQSIAESLGLGAIRRIHSRSSLVRPAKFSQASRLQRWLNRRPWCISTSNRVLILSWRHTPRTVPRCTRQVRLAVPRRDFPPRFWSRHWRPESQTHRSSRLLARS